MKKIFLSCALCIFSIFSLYTNCQGTNRIDSLTWALAKTNQDTAKIHLLHSLASLYSEHDMNMCLNYVSEMLDLTEKLPLEQQGVYLADASLLYLQCNVYDKALELLFQALKIFEASGNQRSIAVIKNSMGGIYFRLNKPEQALKYFKEGLEECQALIQSGDTIFRDNLHAYYNNIGLVYAMEADKQALATTYMEKAIETVSPEDYLNLGQYYNNIALSYFQVGKRDKAFECAYKSMFYRKLQNNEYGIARTNYTLGKLYYEVRDIPKAKNYLEKARESAQQINSSLTLRNVYALLVDVYEAENNYKAANSCLKKVHAIENRLVNDTTLARTTSLKMEYDFAKKTALQQLEVQKTKLKFRLILCICCLLLLSTILFFLFIRNRNKRIRWENKCLEKDLESRNKELTTNVMYLMRNTDLVKEVTKRLVKLKTRLKPENSDVVKDIILDLESLLKEDMWSEFETHFNRVHLDFYKKLKEICPDLSPSELKLCAFLRLNMSSKEISCISGITIKSVEVMRGRIRKKLCIANTDINLVNYLSEF